MNLYNILLAAAPLLTEIPLVPPILQAATQASILADVYGSSAAEQVLTLMAVTTIVGTDDGPPRPEQGGQRITVDWLNSLGNRDCLWRFRYSTTSLVLLAFY
jgi:hypothetical protein